MIRFLFDPKLLTEPSGRGLLYHHQIYASMAHALTATVLPNLSADVGFGLWPRPWEVNVYFAHRSRYLAPTADGETSVFAGHGIADKGWRTPAKVRGYHFICTSGPAWTERYVASGIHPDRILEVGYPKLDPVFLGEIPPPERDDRVRVVWAPTHGGVLDRPYDPADHGRGNGTSTWWHRDQIHTLLPESEFDVIEAPHPRARPDRSVTLAEYVDADVVIADGGSTIYEAWALGIPVVFPDWLVAHARRHSTARATFEAEIYATRIGRHALTAGDLPTLVAQAATRGITDAEVDLIDRIFPPAYRGASGARLAHMLDEIASGVRVPIEEPPMPSADRVLVRHETLDKTIEVTVRRAKVLTRSGWVPVTPTSEPADQVDTVEVVEPARPARKAPAKKTPARTSRRRTVTEPAPTTVETVDA